MTSHQAIAQGCHVSDEESTFHQICSIFPGETRFPEGTDVEDVEEEAEEQQSKFRVESYQFDPDNSDDPAVEGCQWSLRFPPNRQKEGR